MTEASGSLTEPDPRNSSIPTTELDTVTIRFAGDSGDGMQLTGDQFTYSSVMIGNDVITFPDYPAEIRAPAGTLAGVSGFELSFSKHDIHATGDRISVLVAMNPAALKVNLNELEKGGILIVNSNSFNGNDLRKAEYEENPLDSEKMQNYRLVQIPITQLTLKAVEESGLSHREGGRCKNFFALGVVDWLYDRPISETQKWIDTKFNNRPEIAKANRLALQAGYNYAITVELFHERYHVPQAKMPSGEYRQITGNQAVAMGCVAASVQSGLSLFYASYPITPASDILHQLAQYRDFGIKTIQSEDEIAAVSAAIGASFGGSLGVTGTSGPGLDLKGEALGYAVMVELPLVVLNIQRGGPSTGLPTKTEQTDLLTAIHGRHGEAPIPVLAPSTPGESFYMVIEAFRVALKYMTPVILLSDGALANGAEPWMLPDMDSLPDLRPKFRTDPKGFMPCSRDLTTFVRDWAVPGTPGLEHRIGGLEKDQYSGDVSYDPVNHEAMVLIRDAKIRGISKDQPPLEIVGPPRNRLLVLCWGSVYGAALSAVEILQKQDEEVSLLVLKYLYPFHENLGKVFEGFDQILIPEMNLGQLNLLIRAEFQVDTLSMKKVQGRPFLVSEIQDRIKSILAA